MNKTAIKNFAIWARNKLIADITYRAGLMGITEDGIKAALPQSTKDAEFYDIGTKEPYSITGEAVRQRRRLAELIDQKTKSSDYKTAYRSVLEEVAYTWFNRLIAIRFMEVNDYLPSRIRVLSSESKGKLEPDLVTTPFDAELELIEAEQETVMRLKTDNQVDDLFRLLFIKQCNALNKVLPKLFEKTADYTELLLNVSVIDQDGVVYHLVHDIDEDDFNIEKGGQVEIIGWLYQYYNTEPKDEAFALLKKNVKITKERIPAATQLFTPDWIVRYMVENSLGRLWLEGHPNDDLKAGWKYYLDEAEQEAEVEAQLVQIREEYKTICPEDIKVIDPCMGSGHILVYAFDVLMQIYEAAGYTQREAAKSILENNLYGLDIDDRAFQLAYFAVMMKARQYNRRILNGEIDCHVYSIQESNTVNRNHLKYLGAGMNEFERNNALNQLTGLLDTFVDAKEYGSILNVDACDWELLRQFVKQSIENGQMTMDSFGLEDTKEQLRVLIDVGQTMAQKYDTVVTNPPYMSYSNMDSALNEYVKMFYTECKVDLYACFMEKCLELCKKFGQIGMMTSYTWIFLGSFEVIRKNVIYNHSITSFIQPEYHAFFDSAFVPICTFCICKDVPWMKGKYISLENFYGADEQKLKVIEALSSESCSYLYVASAKNFCKLSTAPLAYKATKKAVDNFDNPALGDYVSAMKGLDTCDNDRFVREWYEVLFQNIGFGIESTKNTCNHKWFPYAKGGGYRKWYGFLSKVVNWQNDGEVLRNLRDEKGKIKSRPQNIHHYFCEGLTWSTITSYKLSMRVMTNSIFGGGGSALFPSKDNMFYILGLLNSCITEYYLNMMNQTLNFLVGDILSIPYIDSDAKNEISKTVEECISISQEDYYSHEVSWNYNESPLVKYHVNMVETAWKLWSDECAARFAQLKGKEEMLNRAFIQIYGLQDVLQPTIENRDVTIGSAELQQDICELISYAIGCMFGRYSLDVDGLAYAGGEWDGNKYSSFIPDKDNILPITDEEYFPDDIVGLFCAWLKKVYGEDTLEANLDYIAKALGNKGNTSREIIRNYFLKDFMKDHMRLYQKRPIYWLFDSGKQNGFKALVYMHRYDENTIGNLRIDYLHRMERVYDNEIARMQDIIDNSKAAREVTQATKRREKLQKQLKECKEYDERIAHLALARIPIDLDDGVKVNYEKVQTVDGVKYPVLAKL